MPQRIDLRRGETELVIVVTPYLVKPVSDGDIVLPTDGYKAPTDLERVFLGSIAGGTKPGEPSRPKPSMATPSAPPPSIGAVTPVQPVPVAPVQDKRFIAGLYRWKGRQIFITRGVGNLHHARLFCRPEVSLLQIT